MKPVKRIEIVIDAAHTPGLLKLLDEVGVDAHTLLRDVQGRGERGERSGDELTNVYRNCLVLVACEPELADRVLEVVRPVLKRHGGICLVSDAQWLRH